MSGHAAKASAPSAAPPVGLRGVAEGSHEAAWTHLRTRVDLAGFDAYASHAPGMPAHLVLGRRGAFGATVRRVRGAGLLAVVARTTLSHTVRATTPDREVFAFTEPCPVPLVLNGVPYPHGTMLWLPGAAEIHHRDPGGVDAWSFSFAREEFRDAVRALLGEERRSGAAPLLLTPSAGTLADVRLALLSALHASGPVPRSLVEAILQGVVASLPPPGPGPGPGPGRRDRIRSLLRQRAAAEGLIALADAARGEPLSLIKVCTVLGVPFRTLNAGANLVLGMGAGQYLRRRRLHAVRDRLRTGLAASVTAAATEHGFWELGRFAGDYRALFGESPSTTLRNARAG